MILKTDKEPVLDTLKEKIRTYNIDVIPEANPNGDKRKNGRAERAVQQAEKLIRTLKAATEALLQVRIQVQHPFFSYLVLHAVDSWNKYQILADGETPWQKWKGRVYKGEMTEFGSTE